MTQCRIMGWLFVVALIAFAGCGEAGTAPTAKVSGTVTLDGAPVSNVGILFTPVAGSKTAGRPAGGKTDAAGKYSLTCFKENDGAMPGEYIVTFNGGNLPAGMPEVKKKVEEGKANVIDIALTK